MLIESLRGGWGGKGREEDQKKEKESANITKRQQKFPKQLPYSNGANITYLKMKTKNLLPHTQY